MPAEDTALAVTNLRGLPVPERLRVVRLKEELRTLSCAAVLCANPGMRQTEVLCGTVAAVHHRGLATGSVPDRHVGGYDGLNEPCGQRGRVLRNSVPAAACTSATTTQTMLLGGRSSTGPGGRDGRPTAAAGGPTRTKLGGAGPGPKQSSQLAERFGADPADRW